MKLIELRWEPLIRYLDVNIKEDEKKKAIPGVYIWGFMASGAFNPYYVGRAQNIFMRMAQHFAYIIGGLYCIFDKNMLMNFENYNKSQEKKFDSYKAEYAPHDLRNIYSFYENLDNYQHHLHWMVEHLFFTYTKILESKDRENTEKYILIAIGLENLINTRFGNFAGYKFINKTDDIKLKETLRLFK